MLTAGLGRFVRTGRWLLLAMLGLLHCVLLVGVDNLLAHALILAHLGLFLLWQPLWRGESEVGLGTLLFITLAALVAMIWLNWWIIAFWLTGLFGLVGARVFAFRDRWTRMLYLSVMAYLLAALLLWVVPILFSAQSAIEPGRILVWYVLPIFFVVVLLLPIKTTQTDTSETVDFVYSLLLFMLLTLVVLGSLAFMSLGQLDYLEALLRTLLLLGAVLLALGGVWSPRFGFRGLQVMFSRYLLNIGTPFENWLGQLTEAAQREPDAGSYLRKAITLMADLPWLSGMSWQSSEGDGQIGVFSEFAVEVRDGPLTLKVYARHELHPTLLLHVRLLAQLIGYFYQAKQHEQRLRDITRLQTVYETGSRLTHDLKNMLQSLFSLTSIAQSSDEKSTQLLLQQLPQLTQRIEMIMSKLQQPQFEEDSTIQILDVWWKGLRHRNQHLAIQWNTPDKIPELNIPSALFDCVIDNLLDNVMRKRQTEPQITIIVELKLAPLRLIVCDSGSAVPKHTASKLLQNVVVSENGLGIGLYQAARWATQAGYMLELSSNETGKVCFELQHSASK
ncbi:MAG: sensor histidine kinase [Gallionella sp.]